MKYVISLLILSACSTHSPMEMEEMTRDVLKAKQGIEIDVKPLPKELH